jgi:hypothetical protein
MVDFVRNKWWRKSQSQFTIIIELEGFLQVMHHIDGGCYSDTSPWNCYRIARFPEERRPRKQPIWIAFDGVWLRHFSNEKSLADA